MTLKIFKKILEALQKNMRLFNALYKLNIDIANLNNPLEDATFKLFEELWTDKGADLISWYLYETVEHKIWLSDTQEVVADFDQSGIEGLYNYLQENFLNK